MSKSWKRKKHWSDDERLSEKELRERKKLSKKKRHQREDQFDPEHDPVEAHWQMLNRLSGRYRA